jgi:hypothetical protein
MGIPIAALSPALRAKLGLPGSVRSKYGSRRKELDGQAFASTKEARRYVELQARERAGQIENLQCQPVYYLWVDGHPIARYTADFRYLDRRTGAWVIEDVKGGQATRTEAYRLRKTLVEAHYGIEIQEI